MTDQFISVTLGHMTYQGELRNAPEWAKRIWERENGK